MTATTASQSATRPPRRNSDVLGKIVHNLLVVFDSGWKDKDGKPFAEFRVQCEVVLSVDEAKTVMADLADRTDASLTNALGIVDKKVPGFATELFKKTVRNAFKDNQDNIGLANMERAPRRASDVLGKIVHNLLVVFDSGWKDEDGKSFAEFRVQCEVVLSVDEAKTVMADLAERTDASLTNALDIVDKKVPRFATELFKQTVRNAFKDNQDNIGHAKAQRVEK